MGIEFICGVMALGLAWGFLGYIACKCNMLQTQLDQANKKLDALLEIQK